MQSWAIRGLCAVGIGLLAGCGGGGGESSPNPPPAAGPVEVTVTVIDPSSATGYAAAAALCLDLDANLACDAAEPAGVTGADGKLKVTVAVADQPGLASGQWLVRLTTTFDDTAGNPVSSEVLQVARAGGVAQTQAVVSPLTTWVEQLVLATMARGDAQAAVRERAGLTALDQAADFIAAASGAQAAEAQAARAAARKALAFQTPEMMAVFKSPALEYPQALAGAGVHRVSRFESFFGPGTYEGFLFSTRISQPAGTTNLQFKVERRDFTFDTLQWGQPVVTSQDGPLAGPVLEADGRWTTSAPQVVSEVEGGRRYSAVDGLRRQVEMRNAIALDGQAIDPSHFLSAGSEAPVPDGGVFPAGSLRFRNVVSVALSTYGETDAPFERLGPNGQVLPGPPRFASFDDFVAQYPASGGVWFNLPQTFDEQLAFDAGGVPHFRQVDPFDPNRTVDHGVGTVTTVQFARVTIHRIQVPAPVQRQLGSDVIDLVVHADGLRPIIITQRGTISGGVTRAFNATATEAMLAHVGWPLPPGGL